MSATAAGGRDGAARLRFAGMGPTVGLDVGARAPLRVAARSCAAWRRRQYQSSATLCAPERAAFVQAPSAPDPGPGRRPRRCAEAAVALSSATRAPRRRGACQARRAPAPLPELDRERPAPPRRRCGRRGGSARGRVVAPGSRRSAPFVGPDDVAADAPLGSPPRPRRRPCGPPRRRRRPRPGPRGLRRGGPHSNNAARAAKRRAAAVKTRSPRASRPQSSRGVDVGMAPRPRTRQTRRRATRYQTPFEQRSYFNVGLFVRVGGVPSHQVLAPVPSWAHPPLNGKIPPSDAGLSAAAPTDSGRGRSSPARIRVVIAPSAAAIPVPSCPPRESRGHNSALSPSFFWAFQRASGPSYPLH